MAQAGAGLLLRPPLAFRQGKLRRPQLRPKLVLERLGLCQRRLGLAQVLAQRQLVAAREPQLFLRRLPLLLLRQERSARLGRARQWCTTF